MVKQKTPLVSVVMPVYNTEKYVAEAIESILNQTFKDFEFIIVDDGSTDNSLKIIKEYAKKDKRIRVIVNEKNMNNSASRNKGIKLARGKYIVTQDSDDISLPTRFEQQVKYMEEHPEIGVVGAWIEIFEDETGRTKGIRKYPENDTELRKMIFFCSPIAQPVSFIRKEVFEKIDYYNTEFPCSQDLDLWFRIGTYYKLGNVPEVLVKYRVRSTSLTGSKLRLMEKEANQLRWENKKNKAYYFGFRAFMYNSIHLISLYIVPSKFKERLFNKARDSR